MTGINIKQLQRDCKPTFAEGVAIAAHHAIAWDSKKKGKALSKDGMIRLLFLDNFTQTPRVVSEVVLSRLQAMALMRGLDKQIKLLNETLENAKPGKMKKAEASESKDMSYVG